MNFILPTEEELKLKINSLPPNIKNALNSEDTLFIVRQIGRSFRLEDEQITAIEQLVGMVLLGYVNIIDIASVIEDDIDTPAEWATLIASELKERIFAPIEKDLHKTSIPPKEVFSPKPAGFPKEEKPSTSQARPLTVPSPTKIQPGTDFSQPMPKASPVMPVRMAPIAPSAPIKTAGEKTPPMSAPMASAPATPFILHKEETVRPIIGEKSFKSFEASAPSAIKREEAAPSISARLELGEESLPSGRKKEPVIAKTEIPAPRTVHYSNLRTSLSPAAQEPQGIKPSAPAPMPFSEIPQSTPMTSSETKPSSGGMPLFPKITAESESYLHPLPDLWPKAGSAPSTSTEQARPVEQKPAKLAVEEKKEPTTINIAPEIPPTPSAPPQITPKPTVNINGNTVDLRQTP